MITAEEARNISENNRFNYIEGKIKLAANEGLRSISLDNYFLKDDEKEKLSQLGYQLSYGHGGKRGVFDIISW